MEKFITMVTELFYDPLYQPIPGLTKLFNLLPNLKFSPAKSITGYFISKSNIEKTINHLKRRFENKIPEQSTNITRGIKGEVRNL